MASVTLARALLVAGSPSPDSRSAALLAAAGRVLAGHGVSASTLALRELPAAPLLHGRADDPALRAAAAAVAQAGLVVFATPVYKAACSGLLKVFIDLLPQDALAGKWSWTLATGGSAAHLLAADHSLAPVLDSLGARRRLPTVFATDAQLVRAGGAWSLAADIEARLHAVAADLAFALEGERELQRLRAAAAEPARCSA